ncbi:MAG: hypothetical protein CMP66_07440 [Flavobacteriales bacterium]|nr:hypothetical protein [Flavobacteriales bacterium]
MKYDFLIVGQGIAGSIIGLQLEQYNQRFLIVDKNEKITSSKIAAGLMHPMSFKRCVLNWKGETLYDYSHQFYTKCNEILSDKTYCEFPLIRLFQSYEEQNNWLSKVSSKPFVNVLSEKEEKFKEIINPFGNGRLKKSAKLDASAFLKIVKLYFERQNKIREESFSIKNLQKDGDFYERGNDLFRHIIFCQGPFIDPFNPFSYLPIIPNKGEILEIQSQLLPQFILSKGVFSIPTAEDKFILGATYNHRDLTEIITEKARVELFSKVKKFLPHNDFKIINQKYGFRPTTIDRKPLIGNHPILKNTFIFNGMGSKSILMAPLLGKQLIEHILFGKKLSETVSVSRFDHYFSAQHKELCSKLVT